MGLKNSVDVYDFIKIKYSEGLTIMETIKEVMSEYGLSLGASKEVVSAHPVWSGIVKAAQPLHDELNGNNMPHDLHVTSPTKRSP